MPGLLDASINSGAPDPNVVNSALSTLGGDSTTGALTTAPISAAGTVTGVNPSQRTLNPGTDTVSGQLKTLLGDSPLEGRVRAINADAYNARGLQNTSMAVEGGTKALLDSALPIATADAGFYNTAGSQNQAASNVALGQTAAAANAPVAALPAIEASGAQQRESIAAQTASTEQLQAQKADIDKQLQAIAIQAQTGLTAQQAEAQQRLQAQSGDIQKQLAEQKAAEASALSTQTAGQEVEVQKLKGDQAQALADTQAAYQTLLQTSASATSTFNQISANITKILDDATTDMPTKQALLANQQDLLKAGLAIIGGIGNISLGPLLTFTSPRS